MSGALDLSKLPPPAAVEPLSFDAILGEHRLDLIQRLPGMAAVVYLPSEPASKLAESYSWRELLLRNRINQGFKASTLAFSTGADLDVAAANLAVERLPGEGDEDLRARAVMAPDAWSVAGPRKAYEFHAKSASPLVAGVAVSSPSPGVIRVVVLSDAVDGVADADLLATVSRALNHEDVCPFDQVDVVSAGVSPFDVRARLKIHAGPDPGPVLQAAEAAVRAYAAKRRRLDGSIVHKALIAALMQPGVEDIDLIAPAGDIAAIPDTAPVLRDLSLEIEVLP